MIKKCTCYIARPQTRLVHLDYTYSHRELSDNVLTLSNTHLFIGTSQLQTRFMREHLHSRKHTQTIDQTLPRLIHKEPSPNHMNITYQKTGVLQFTIVIFPLMNQPDFGI